MNADPSASPAAANTRYILEIARVIDSIRNTAMGNTEAEQCLGTSFSSPVACWVDAANFVRTVTALFLSLSAPLLMGPRFIGKIRDCGSVLKVTCSRYCASYLGVDKLCPHVFGLD